MRKPLYTDPALEFLDTIVDNNWRVFEYGGGHSTHFFTTNCAEVYTIDHNQQWYNTIVNESPTAVIELADNNVAIVDDAILLDQQFDNMKFNLPIRTDHDHNYNQYHGLINYEHRGYASIICKKPKGYFDCVVVDGMARSLCLWYAMHMVADNGVIILDTSDRWHFNDVQCYLIENGFNRKDFWQPGHPSWCTSFFSKTYEPSADSCKRLDNTGDIYHF